MKMQKHRYSWMFTGLAAICCTILICFASGTVQAAPLQAEHIAQTSQVCNTPVLDYASLPNGMETSEYADTLEGAALQLRKQLKDWESNPVVYLRWESIDDFDSFVANIFYLAEAHTGDPKEGDYIIFQCGEVSVNATYYEDEAYYLTLEYNVPYYTTKEQEKALDKAVKDLLKELDLDDATEYEKIKGVYDWLCQNVTYDNKNLEDDTYLLKHTAYAAIVNKTAVCQGYATAMYRLLLELGVDVRYVGGIGNGGAHGWNIVKIGQKYYNLDATWDANYAQNDQPYQYFLKNDEDFTDHTRDNERFDFVNTDNYPLSATSYNSNDDKPTTGWQQDKGKWYYLDANGKKVTGWLQYNGKWYYLDANGYMTTGWLQYKGSWYYLDADGKMATNTWRKDAKGWIWLNSNGTMTKNQWLQYGGKWYYLDANGYMATGWLQYKGSWYYLDADGKMATNTWRKDAKGWIWLNSNGTMTKNQWLQYDGKWYYLNASGYMATGWLQYKGSWYYLEADGKMATNTWCKDSKGWIWLNSNGTMTKSQWVLYGGQWYYLNANGYMVANASIRYNGKTYYFNASGVCTNP